MSVTDQIEGRLRAAFSPDTLEVLDESEQHRGHAGYQEGGESHFRVRIKSGQFAPMTRIKRHRAVHEAVGKDLMARIHALAIEIEM